MPSATNPRYRIFISYCHHDLESVEKIVEILEQNEMTPLWDNNLDEGAEFKQNILMFIQHAQVIVPVISQTSAAGGWVHEEIGYALAYNIPLLPIVIGDNKPGQMLEDLHAFKWKSPFNIKDLQKVLAYKKIEKLIDKNKEKTALYECAAYQQDRTRMIREYASIIQNLFPEHEAVIRQIGGLSSFHIPLKHPEHEDWCNRIGGKKPDEQHCEMLYGERKLIGKMGRDWGFRIMINPWYPYKQHGRNAPLTRITRLTNLLEFLEKLPKTGREKYGVVLDKQIEAHSNTLIVGDLFMASTRAGRKGKGYLQTIFTRHSITIRDQIEKFDAKFIDALGSRGMEQSLDDSIRIIRSILEGVKGTWEGKH
jgi:hypothetical protein